MVIEIFNVNPRLSFESQELCTILTAPLALKIVMGP